MTVELLCDLQDWELTVTTNRWRYWPAHWPLGMKTSTWEKRARRDEAEAMVKTLRAEGVFAVDLREIKP